MAFGFASTKENSAQEKPKANSNKPKWFKKKRDVWNDTHANSGAKVECFVCKGEHVLTSCETWKKLAVNERWELAKKLGLCFRCLKRGHRIKRCSLKGTCPVEGCLRRHHPQLHAVIAPAQLNPTAEAFHPPQAAAETVIVESLFSNTILYHNASCTHRINEGYVDFICTGAALKVGKNLPGEFAQIITA